VASVLYATISDLRLVLDSTDAGTGTGAQLSEEQLTLAIAAASGRVSLYAGAIFDSSSPAAEPPDVFNSLTLDIAAWYAMTYYMKSKQMGPNSPVVLRYVEAMKVLEDARDGKVSLTVGVSGSNSGSALVINRIPNIFRPEDSNTITNPFDNTLDADSPLGTGLANGWLGINSGVEGP
jgi:phage gp36-like protein